MSDRIHVDYGDTFSEVRDEDGAPAILVTNEAFHLPDQLLTFAAPEGSHDRAAQIDALVAALRRLR